MKNALTSKETMQLIQVKYTLKFQNRLLSFLNLT